MCLICQSHTRTRTPTRTHTQTQLINKIPPFQVSSNVAKFSYEIFARITKNFQVNPFPRLLWIFTCHKNEISFHDNLQHHL